MGQQQLLLLVLGIVIVGLAVVVGIQSFNEGRQKSEIDRYTGIGVEMAGDIIAHYSKPRAMGGGGQSSAALGTLTVSALGLPQTFSDTYAGYTRTGYHSNGIRRDLMMSTTNPAWHITTYPLVAGGTRVEVYVFGPRPECVVSRSNYVGVATWSDGNNDATPPANPNSARCAW